jgi:hypothetical protein
VVSSRQSDEGERGYSTLRKEVRDEIRVERVISSLVWRENLVALKGVI